MGDGVVIRRGTRKDLPAILELIRVSLGDDIDFTASFFTWKHFENPFGESLILLAEDAQGLVGLRVMMQWSFVVEGRHLQAVRPVDTATHPRFRRRGLFRRLTEALLAQLAAEGIDFVYNTPNDTSLPGYLKMGWRSVGRLPIWVRPGGRFCLRMADVRRPFEASALVCSQRPGPRLQTDRSGSYFAWRYGPGSDLAYGMARRSGSGVVFRERERAGRTELTLVELVVPTWSAVPSTANLVRDLLRSGREFQAVAMASLRSREAAALGLAGFVCIPGGGPHLVYREVPERGALPFDPGRKGSWRVQIGDLELF